MFYEIIYESGEVSVASYDSDEEATAAITEQHNRAKNGQKNGPQQAPASRIVKVLVYSTHPGSLYEAGGMSSDEVKKRVDELLKGHDVVDPGALALQLQSITHPMHPEVAVHESRFKMDADRELKLELA